MTEPYHNQPATPTKIHKWLYPLVVITTSLTIANLNAITDFVLHPDIPYFDEEHLIVGGISGILTALILAFLAASHLKLRKSELNIKALNANLEYRIEERTAELEQKNLALSAIEQQLRQQLKRNSAAQEELRQSKLLLHAIIDNSFEMQGLLTPEGKLIEANKASLDLIQADKKAVIGLNFWETPWWNHNPPLQDQIREAVARVASGECLRFETENQDAAGNIRIIDFSLKPIFNDQKQVMFLMPEGRDITEHRELERQFLQQQKLDSIGLLASGIAHDFNNLLTPILGYADMICNRVPPDDPIHEESLLIWDAANSASGLIKQLLGFSRSQELLAQHIDLNWIITSFSLILRRTIREDIEIKELLSPDTCQIVADRNQIEQVLLNLAVNSQSAIDGAGTISIETGHLILDDEFCHLHPGATPGPYVLLAFSDTGSGIPQSVLPHIFEPFYSTADPGFGKGLGLFSVYSIVRQHDGFIDVQSSPETGTTFCIYFPESLAGSDDDLSIAHAAGAVSTRPGTIILVEDNMMVMDMTRSLLKHQGHGVVAFHRPEDALAYVRETSQAADLLLTDVIMPVMGGPELYGKLRETVPELKVLFMSGYITGTVWPKGVIEEGMNFISKPFTTEALIRKVAEIIG